MRRAEAQPRLGHPRPARRAHRQCDPKVRHQRLSLVQQDVLGLDVAVDDVVAVGVVERVRHLAGDPHRVVDGELLLVGEPVAQRFAFDVGHDVVEEAVHLPGIDEAEDVRVLEIGGDLDLFEEAVGADDGGELGAEHLEGDLAVVLQVVGQVNGRHAAVAEFALDAVAVGEGRGETGVVGHRFEVRP